MATALLASVLWLATTFRQALSEDPAPPARPYPLPADSPAYVRLYAAMATVLSSVVFLAIAVQSGMAARDGTGPRSPRHVDGIHVPPGSRADPV